MKAIEVDFSTPCNLPSDNHQRIKTFFSNQTISLSVDHNGNLLINDEIIENPGDIWGAQIIDALIKNPDLYPGNWKEVDIEEGEEKNPSFHNQWKVQGNKKSRRIFFHKDLFIDLTESSFGIRHMYWEGDMVISGYGLYPAAM
jgi:hypothetical protein